MMHVLLLLSRMDCAHLISRVVERRSPPIGTILWVCLHQTPDWCCREFLWAQLWYPRRENLPGMHPENVSHRARSVESFFQDVRNVGDPGFNLQNAHGYLQCLTTEEIVDPDQGQMMRTNRRLIYPCSRAARLETWEAPSIRNPASHILKGACYGPMARLSRILVRTFSTSSCMRAVTAVPQLLMRVHITLTRIIPSHPGRIAPEPQTAQVPSLVIQDLTAVPESKFTLRQIEDGSFSLEDLLVGHEYEICVYNGDSRFDFCMATNTLAPDRESCLI